MSFGDMMKEGITRIYLEDKESLQYYVGMICSDVRDMEPDVLYRAGAFFVANDDYMAEWFGQGITNPEYEIYRMDGTCLWLHNLVLPVVDAVGEVVGLAGFNPFRYLEAHQTNNWMLNYYMYSSKHIFDKSRFLYSLPGTLRQGLQDGYLVITDGIFDTLSLSACGIHAAALLGSFLSPQVAAVLRFYDRVLLAMDNDDAGLKLYGRLSKVLDNVILVKQGWAKDVDDVLKSQHRNLYLSRIHKILKTGMPNVHSLGGHKTTILN